MGAETQSDCPFCAENARARREAFERDVLPELEAKRDADQTGFIDRDGI